ncbi:transcriptional regulator [Chromobacterium amazonense]|uniref:Transcriptional regulator n=1 Tax=Chromobacterium amazonense TaxID=1382803 RepID=A0A2S9X724_9NEIS|nr:transcriptional regulator [Chromobacterium amazonense]PRP71521.1 transcriptional regulator [Chromobacterium amazonense]
MLKITNYQAPCTEDLTKLKVELGYTGEQMAELVGLAGNNQWRKYTGGTQPREMNFHMLFYLAAKMTLSDDQIINVLDKMQEIGSSFKIEK